MNKIFSIKVWKIKCWGSVVIRVLILEWKVWDVIDLMKKYTLVIYGYNKEYFCWLRGINMCRGYG